MSQQIMKLAFDKNTSIEDILEELIYYKTIMYASLILIKLNKTNNQLDIQKEYKKVT